MMVSSELVDVRLRALSDPTRRDIVARTLQNECNVTDLAAAYPMSFAAVQRHVAVLEDAGLVVKRAAHRHRFVRAQPGALDETTEALDSLRSQWHARVERIHDALVDPPEERR